MIQIVLLHGLVGSKRNFEYLKKELGGYSVRDLDLIGFGAEVKPNISYNLKDFISFLEKKLDLSKENDMQYVLVGHSLGALLSKELAKKYPHKVKKIFLLGYPFLGKKQVLNKRGFFDRFYAEGAWWTRVLCEMRLLFKLMLLPFIYLFGYKYRASWIDYFNHTYQSAYGTISNTILNDSTDDLYALKDKIVFINGENDGGSDIGFAETYKQYIIPHMGHRFFNFEKEIGTIIKSELGS